MTKKRKVIIGVSIVAFVLVIMLLNWLNNVRESHRQALQILERGSEALQQEIDKVEEEIANRSYQQVFSFSGTGVKNSEPFTIQGSRFKIKYSCTGDLCQAFLDQTSGGFGGDVIMNSPGSISDETIFYKKGEYYISANVLGDFTFIVEDYK